MRFTFRRSRSSFSIVIGVANALDRVLFREHRHPAAQLAHKRKIVGGDNDGLARFIQGEDQLHEEALRPWIEAVRRLVEEKDLGVHGKDRAQGHPLLFAG